MHFKVFKNSIDSDVKNELFSLLSNNFNKTHKYYEWKQCSNAKYSIEKYTYCFFDEGKCIATLLMIVDNFHHKGKKFRYALMADGATHKDYRRMGLFESLLNNAILYLADEKVEFVLGTGNKTSRKTFIKKLNYRDFTIMFKARYKVRYKYSLLNIISFTKKMLINIKPVNRKLQVVDIDYKSYFDYNQKLLTQFDSYFYHELNGFLWRVNKPRSNYKYKALFDENSDLIAISLINYLEDHLYIEDFVFKQEKELYARHLIRYIQKEAFGLSGINRILFSHNLNERLQNVFEKEGFKIKIGNNSVLYKLIPGSTIQLEKLDVNKLHFARIHKNE